MARPLADEPSLRNKDAALDQVNLGEMDSAFFGEGVEMDSNAGTARASPRRHPGPTRLLHRARAIVGKGGVEGWPSTRSSGGFPRRPAALGCSVREARCGRLGAARGRLGSTGETWKRHDVHVHVLLYMNIDIYNV